MFASKRGVQFVKMASPRRTAEAGAPRKHLQSGQALVELALVLPILLILALGVIELGRYAYIAILVGNAAHAGAVYGSQNTGDSSDTTGIQNAAYYDFAGGNGSTNNANGQLNSSLTVNSSVSCGCDSGGAVTNFDCANTPSCATGHWVITVSVTAFGTFNSLFNYPGIPSSVTVSRTSTMRVL
jgi:Flp pilus assembly protein TadG